MDIEILQEIKDLSTEALKGRKLLKKIHDSYIKKLNAGETTRAITTTYNARTHDIMTNRVKPSEFRLRELLKCNFGV